MRFAWHDICFTEIRSKTRSVSLRNDWRNKMTIGKKPLHRVMCLALFWAGCHQVTASSENAYKTDSDSTRDVDANVSSEFETGTGTVESSGGTDDGRIDTETGTPNDGTEDSGDIDSEPTSDTNHGTESADAGGECDPEDSWTFEPIIPRPRLDSLYEVTDNGFSYWGSSLQGDWRLGDSPGAPMSFEDYEYYLMGIDAAGQVVWHVSAPFWLDDTTQDLSGGLVALGRLTAPVTVGSGVDAVTLTPVDSMDFVVARFGVDGSLASAFLATGSGNCLAQEIALTDDGTVLVQGYYQEACEVGRGDTAVLLRAPEGTGYFTAEFDTDGSLRWIDYPAKTGSLTGTEGGVRDEWTDVMVAFHGGLALEDGSVRVLTQHDGKELAFTTEDGEVLVSSEYEHNLYISDLTSAGVHRNLKRVAASDEMALLTAARDGTSLYKICPDRSAYLSICSSNAMAIALGEGDNQALFSDDACLVARLDSDGNLAWVQEPGYTPLFLGTSCGGTVAVSGLVTNHISLDSDTVVAAFDDAGARMWQWQSGSIDRDWTSGLRLLPDGRAVVFSHGERGPSEAKHVRMDMTVLAADGEVRVNRPVVRSEPGADGEDLRFEHLFYPPATICEPADVSEYAHDARVELFFASLKSEALTWMDESCFRPCADMGEFDTCIEADCTSESGATVHYTYTYRNTVLQPGAPCSPGSDSQTEEHIVIELPEGLDTWTRLEWNKTHQGYVVPECDGGARHSTGYSASWRGNLDPLLPEDGGGEYQSERWWNDAGGESVWEWHTEGFDLFLENDLYSFSTAITVNGVTFKEGEGDTIWMDDECAGVIEDETWKIIDDC